MTRPESDRLAIVETKLDAMGEAIKEISDTLSELRKVSIQNEDNRKRIQQLEARMDKRESAHTELKSYIESRWYVLVTAVVIAQIAVQIGFRFLG